MRLVNIVTGVALVVTFANGCQPAHKVNIKPGETKTAVVPTPPPTNR